MADRFPDIDWYCDYCNAYLNDQGGFDDSKYILKGEEWGRKSSIASDNIIDGVEVGNYINDLCNK